MRRRILQRLRDYYRCWLCQPAAVSKSYRKEWYRKAVHLSSLWIPAFIYFAHPGTSVVLFALLLAGDVVVEYANFKHYRWARRTFGRLFCRTLRNKETVRSRFQVSGSMYVLSSAILCTLLFSKPVAVIALTVMLVSDSFAALIGKAYGTRRLYKNKSLEGTAAFFMSALVINMAASPIWPFTYISVFACLAATAAEMFEDKLEVDDNLSIPLIVGFILTVFTV